MLSSTKTITVRFSECDPLNIVWHGNYAKYFEEGRNEFGKQHGLDFVSLYNKHHVIVPLVQLEFDFKRTATHGDELQVRTTFIDSPAAKIIFAYEMTDRSGNIVCTGRSVQVFVDAEKKELQLTVPSFFEKWKSEKLR